MRLLTKCPDCGTGISLTLADADRRKRCPRCGRLFRVPDTDALAAALTLLQTAQADVYVDEQGRVYG